MPIQTRRYHMLLGAVCLVIATLGYGGFMIFSKPQGSFPTRTFSKSQSAVELLDLQLPSVIPNLNIAAKQHFFHKIDLRRAEIVMAIAEDEPVSALVPLMDKVLVVPKSFIR
ncbi:MAG: hypothetical protein CK424_08295 [Legionella sp.]|nr:MAG: hypothetical protein CK424_08295 [Legionella sp.]